MKRGIFSMKGQAAPFKRHKPVFRLFTILALVSLSGVVLTATIRANTITWISGNGSWDTVTNWDAGVAPGPGDTARFNDSATQNGYAVGLSVSNEVVGNVLFNADNFGMYLRAGTNTLTVTTSYLLDEPAGTIAVDTLRTGVAAVTNSTGTGVFQVGNDGDSGVGLLTMQQQYTNSVADATATNNPTVIADNFYVTSSSTFLFQDGTLTTGGGSISAASTFSGLSPVAGDIGTWNIHGTNLVTSGGAVEFAVTTGGTLDINVAGPNTLWSVNGTECDIGYNGFVNLVISGGAVVTTTNGTYTYISRNGLSCSNNTVSVSGAGTLWLYNSLLWVGNASQHNTMTVSAGAQMSGGGVELGGGASSSNNVLTVTDTNTTWNLADVLEVGGHGPNNTLIISNGAQIVDAGTTTLLGQQTTSTGNSVLVDGPGTVWSTAGAGKPVTVGNQGAYSTVIVKNGGQVISLGVNDGDGSAASNCTVLVTGPGSLWNDAGKFSVGISSGGNQLIVTNGAQLNTANLYVGFGDTATGLGNSAVVAGGSLFVTNAGAALYIGGGNTTSTFTFNGGTATVNELVLSSASIFNFNSGVLNVAFAIVTNGSPFVVGNGVGAATLNLLPSFLHVYSSGLNISANGTLTGIGTISNNVTLANGSTLAPGVSGVGTQTVDGTLVLGSTTASDFGLGLPGDSQSFVSVNGNLTLNGTLNISNVGGFGVGTYTLFAYTGTLTTNGSPSILTIGSTPNGSLTYKVDISTAGEVNLDVTSGPTSPFVTWQDHYFTSAELTNAAYSGPNADPLGKGISNTNQFLAGFNPTNAAAYLHIINIAKTNSNTDIQVTYLGANGDSTYSGGPASRTNVLEFATGTANGSYTNNFTSTGQTNILSGGTGLGVVTNMVDSGGATNKPSRFYRVRVILP